VRLDLHVVAVGLDRAARADVDALVAAVLSRAAMGADARVVGEELRLLELADQRADLLRRERLLERIVAGCEIALGRQLAADQRLARQIEDNVEAFLARNVGAREIDGADRAAGLDACTMRLAL